MAKPTKQQKALRRKEAKARIWEIKRIAYQFKIRDAVGAHITIWSVSGARIDWWPGAGKWKIGNVTQEGGFDDLIDYIVFLDWVKEKRYATITR